LAVPADPEIPRRNILLSLCGSFQPWRRAPGQKWRRYGPQRRLPGGAGRPGGL